MLLYAYPLTFIFITDKDCYLKLAVILLFSVFIIIFFLYRRVLPLRPSTLPELLGNVLHNLHFLSAIIRRLADKFYFLPWIKYLQQLQCFLFAAGTLFYIDFIPFCHAQLKRYFYQSFMLGCFHLLSTSLNSFETISVTEKSIRPYFSKSFR